MRQGANGHQAFVRQASNLCHIVSCNWLILPPACKKRTATESSGIAASPSYAEPRFQVVCVENSTYYNNQDGKILLLGLLLML